MRTLGLLGGMSWESTAIYYRLLNEGVARIAGGLHSAPLLLHSFDFAPIAKRQAAEDWAGLAAILATASRRLASAGAEAILLCTNTMHRLHAETEQAAGVPVLHIADATGEALLRAGSRAPVLLGTRFTMEGAFYRERLRAQFGIDAHIPDAAGRATVHRVIYEELCRGVVRDASRAAVLACLMPLLGSGADAVILGCTELTMLLGADDVPAPVLDTTALHAAAGVRFIAGSA